MKMFYHQFLAFFLMITITLLTLGMTFLGLSRSIFVHKYLPYRLHDTKKQTLIPKQRKRGPVMGPPLSLLHAYYAETEEILMQRFSNFL